MGETMDIETRIKMGQSIRIFPEGYSMYPLLVPGRDEVILSPLPDRNLRRGEVVLYRREQGILVLHRIWKQRQDAFYMVGDNQVEVEGPIAREQLIGIMTGLVRKGKLISVNNPAYCILCGIWLCLRPVRRWIAVPVAYLKRCMRRIRHKE